MEAGEKELRKVFEDVTTNNVRTISDYTSETRKLQRELEKTVIFLEKKIMTYDSKINEMQQSIAALQAKMYKNNM